MVYFSTKEWRSEAKALFLMQLDSLTLKNVAFVLLQSLFKLLQAAKHGLDYWQKVLTFFVVALDVQCSI